MREAGFERPPEQTEFARLELDYTVLSKRKLLRLVNDGHVTGWDDPRMPTIAGLRRRGVTPEAIRDFADTIGVARSDARIELATFEHAVRDDLNMRVPRVMAVARPLKLVITNYPDGPGRDARRAALPARRAEDRIAAGAVLARALDRAGRLHGGPAEEVLPARARAGGAAPLRLSDHLHGGRQGCGRRGRRGARTYDPATRGGDAPDGRRVQGTIHWVSAPHALDCELRLYDRLFAVPDPDAVPEGQDFIAALNPESLVTLAGAKVEPSVGADPPGSRYQFERTGYFISDPMDSGPGGLVFNRTVALRDSWARQQGR